MILARKITRVRSLPNAGSRTLHFKIDYGKSGVFFQPNEVPSFEGEEAWFEMEKVKGQWRFLRQVESPQAKAL